MEDSSIIRTPTKRNATKPLQTIATRRSMRGRTSINQHVISDDIEAAIDEDDGDDGNVDDEIQCKSMTYFDTGVSGQQIYSFKTPKKKDAMVAKAHNTPKTPKSLNVFGTPKTPTTPKTPSAAKTPRQSSLNINLHKTPAHIRSKNRKVLKRTLRDDEADEVDDFDGESSDEYSPSQSETEDDSEDDSLEDEQQTATITRRRLTINPMHRHNLRHTRQSRQQDLIFESDKYFGHTNKKAVTSDNTLDSLKTPRLKHEELFKLLSTMETSNEHKKCIQEIQSQYEISFPKWLFILKEGYNIILHGLGSKRNILERLHSTHLMNENVLIVNGYFPNVTIHDILDNIVVNMLETSFKSKNLHEIVDAIEAEMNLTPDYHIYLIVHNLEGAMLRNEMAQSVLSRLAHIRNIHLIASIDHINTPNLWDNIQLSHYNFSWWDVTSFMPYSDETSVVENSMLVKNSGALAISSMKSVFLSLTQNARGIYMIIVKNQLANSKTPNFQGMPFKNLYKKCLEAFLVSSDNVLRTQLNEFYDHNLLKAKRSADGTEQLKIPVDNILLQKFVEQYGN